MKIVKTYMAHHQGMSLCAINNYINHGILQNRFTENKDIRATEILLKERERMRAKPTINSTDRLNTFKQRNIDKYTTGVSCLTYSNKDSENNDKEKFEVAFLNGYGMSAIYTSMVETI